MVTANDRKHLGTGKEGNKEGRKVISCFHGVVISAWLLKFSDFQRNICFGSKLPCRAVHFKKESRLVEYSIF